MEFKDRIKSLRDDKGLSPSKLGAAMDKSEGAVRSWETGKAKPDADTLIRLAKYFDCSTDYLLGLDDNKNKETLHSLNESLMELQTLLVKTGGASKIVNSLLEILSSLEVLSGTDEMKRTEFSIASPTESIEAILLGIAGMCEQAQHMLGVNELDAAYFSGYSLTLDTIVHVILLHVNSLAIYLMEATANHAASVADNTSKLTIKNIKTVFVRRSSSNALTLGELFEKRLSSMHSSPPPEKDSK